MKMGSSVLPVGRRLVGMRAMGDWLDARPARERGLILCLGLLICICVLWYGVAKPIFDMRNAAQTRLTTAEATHMRLTPPSAVRGAGHLEPLQGSMSDVMLARASALGLSLTQVASDGSQDGASAVIVSGRYDLVMPFIATIERVDGAQIETLSLVSVNEPGLVRLQISARRP